MAVLSPWIWNFNSTKVQFGEEVSIVIPMRAENFNSTKVQFGGYEYTFKEHGIVLFQFH